MPAAVSRAGQPGRAAANLTAATLASILKRPVSSAVSALQALSPAKLCSLRMTPTLTRLIASKLASSAEPLPEELLYALSMVEDTSNWHTADFHSAVKQVCEGTRFV